MITEEQKHRIRICAAQAYVGREQYQPRYLRDYLAGGTLGDLHGVEADIRNQRAIAQTPELRELYDLLALVYRAETLTTKGENYDDTSDSISLVNRQGR